MERILKYFVRFGEFIRKLSIKIGAGNLITSGFILVILILSFITRFRGLGNPTHLVFDENFFVPIAQDYLDGKFHGDPHSPLGRLLITAGAYIYKDSHESEERTVGEGTIVKGNIVQYRIAPAFFGALIPIVVFFITKLFTNSNTFSFLAAFMLIFDNAILVHTRFALFDEILMFFVLMSLLLSLCFIRYVKGGKEDVYKKGNLLKRFVFLILAGLFAGAAVATKLTGLSATAILYLAVIYKTYKDRFGLSLKSNLLVFLQILTPALSIAGMFFFAWWIHFSIIKYPGKYIEEYSPAFQECFQGDKSRCKLSLYELTSESLDWSFNYESLVPPIDFCKEGEMGSLPYQWPLMTRTIAYSFTNHAGIPLSEVSYVYLTGNPVVWYSALFGLILAFSLITPSFFLLKSLFDKEIIFLIFVYLLNYIPYFFIDRVMYFYHYFLAFIISVIIFSYLVKKFYDLHKNKRIIKRFGKFFIIQYLLIVLIGFLVYSPLTYNKKVDIGYMEKIILTDLWNMKSDPYNYNR